MRTIMRGIFIIAAMLISFTTSAAEQRIYQTDSLGNVQYHKPSHTIESNGRIVETDSVGNKLYHKQQYQIKDGKIYQRDSVGNIQYHKPGFVVQGKK